MDSTPFPTLTPAELGLPDGPPAAATSAAPATPVAPAAPAKPAAREAEAASDPPELSDEDYAREVLGQTQACKTEDDIEQDLAAKAAALGVEIRPLSAYMKLPTSGAESAVSTILLRSHPRTASTGSHRSVSTGLTSTHSTVIPATLIESRPETARPATFHYLQQQQHQLAGLCDRSRAQLAASTHNPGPVLSRRRPKSLTFSKYHKYLSKVDPALNQPKFLSSLPPFPTKSDLAISLFSVGSRKRVKELKRSIASKLWKKKAVSTCTTPVMCICCREDFDSDAVQTLLCGHTYCSHCLAVIIRQSTTDESKMPPRCCTQPVSGAIVKTVLNRDEQTEFLKAVLQYSTPWESRIFCPNTECGEFIPPRSRIDPKHPFEVVCKACKTRVCVMCKRNAHLLDQDCPDDWELEAVLKIGERSGWRRCYKCRMLVELSAGCTHMTCRCKAQFCYICGAVWEPLVGCPNFCNGDEELERRRAEEEARQAEQEAETRARAEADAREAEERREAEARTRETGAFLTMRRTHEDEMARFRAFERKMLWVMWTRHSQRKLALVERYADLADRMRERHAKTEVHLEDRQIEAEIELRASLEASERSCRIKLKHMEAFCSGLGFNGAGPPSPSLRLSLLPPPSPPPPVPHKRGDSGSGSKPVEKGKDSPLPSREVTQRHLEQLGQQYHVRDGMERRHKAQINVLREKQAKRMEELLERHESEAEALADRRAAEMEDLAVAFADEEDALSRGFLARRARMIRRWGVAAEVLRRELEDLHELHYAPMELAEWPAEMEGDSRVGSGSGMGSGGGGGEVNGVGNNNKDNGNGKGNGYSSHSGGGASQDDGEGKPPPALVEETEASGA